MILIDSDVLICHLRGVSQARDWLHQARQRDRLAVSVVTITELTGGMRSAERRGVWSLLASMHTEPVDELIARSAGQLIRDYRTSHAGIGVADYLIAATALARGAELATLNVRHFPMFAGLRAPFALP